ncbi:MAG: ATP-binding protein [Ekhidna sp.]
MRTSSKEQLYKIIAHSSTDYLSIVSSDYEYLAVNETYAKGFNRKTEEIEGRKVEELLGKDGFRHLVKPNFDKCLEEKEVIMFEDWFEVSEGRAFFSVSYTPIEIEAERVVVVNAHDNTRHKLLEDSLEKAVEDLKAAHSYKDKLFSVVSHDLRSPIIAINSFLELIGDEETGFDQIRSLVPLMSSKLQTTKAMLDNLLGWASTQIKGQTVAFEKFSMREIVEENTALYVDEITKKSLSIVNEIPDGLSINGDKNGVRMIIRNLLSNAIKFSFEDGSIKVSAQGEPVDGFQFFHFSDNGKGMPSEKARNLFSGTVNSEKGTQGELGTGLGMMLTADAITAHGGTITVESMEGEGTNYSFSLPATSPY